MKRNVVGHGAKVIALKDMGVHNKTFDMLDDLYTNVDESEGEVCKHGNSRFAGCSDCVEESNDGPLIKEENAGWDVDVDENGPFIVKGTLS